MKTNSNNESAICAESINTINNAKANKTSVYFSGCVGTFAKYTDKKGSPVFGMVDSIFSDGLRVGFVHCAANGAEWTSELIWADDIAQCTDADEIEIARESAVRYYENEAEYIRARIARRYEIDDEQKLAEMLAECDAWLEMLTQNTKEDTNESDEANSAK